MHIFRCNSTNFQKNLSDKNHKIRVELDISNVEFCLEDVEFQNSSILLHSLKIGLFDYII